MADIDKDTLNNLIPSDAFEYNGHSYYVYSNVADTWEAAQAFCESLGGHLAVINNAKENSALFGYITNSGYTNVFFGLSDAKKEGTWTWVDGTKLTYTNWSYGEPNGSTGENYCMFFYGYTNGKWNDGDFNLNSSADYYGGRNFLCEWDTLKKSWKLDGITAKFATSVETLASINGAKSLTGLSVSNNVVTLKNSALNKNVSVSGEYEFDFASDYEKALISGSAKADLIKFFGSNVSVSGGKGADAIFNYGAKKASIVGGDGDDSIMSLLNGTIHPDSCTLIGGNGNDTLWNDGEKIPYGGIKVLIDGGKGADAISNDGANSTMLGGAGNDFISNWGEKSSINGGTGDDFIYNRNDSAEKRADKVTITGGAGNDTIFNGDEVSNGGSSVSINGGDGKDVIYNGYSSVVGGDYVTILGGAGKDSIFLCKGVGHYVDCGTDADFSYIETDWFTITGGDGDDTITGHCSFSSINGGYGNDKITITNWSKITVNAGTGNDTLSIKDNGDAVNQGYGVLYQYANGDGNDLIKNFSANETLKISGGEYSTTKSGKNIIVTVGEGKISLMGAASLSTVNIIGETVATTSDKYKFNAAKTAVTLFSAFKDKTFDAAEYGSKIATINAAAVKKDIELIGNPKANKIIGGKGNNTIEGGEGKDSLTGGAGADVFVYYNGDGNDIITDYTADDTVLIKDAVASLSTSRKDIVLKVGNGKITLKGAADKAITYVDKNGEHDYINGEQAVVTNSKTATIKDIYWKNSFEVADFSSAIQTVNASAVDNDIKIVGNAKKANNIIGGYGNDTLIGGKKGDTLYGGEGRDIFVYSKGEGNDLIVDYTPGEDKISIASGSIINDSVSGYDVIFTVGTNKITVQSGAGKVITVIDADGKESSRLYSANIAWFLEDDNNFSTDNQLSDLIETKTYLPAQVDYVDSFKDNQLITYSDKK